MIGKKIIELDNIASTNRYALSLVNKEKIEEGTIIYAINQNDGKGTGNNKWESEKGKNLTISIVLKPHFLPIHTQFYLNVFSSLAVSDMIQHMLACKEQVKIKWPNDIYYENKKISGILIENSILGDTMEYAIVGIGININQEKFISNAPNPVSLFNISGKTYNLKECLSQLNFCFNKRYEELKQKNLKMLMQEYHEILYRKDIFASFKVKNTYIYAKINGVTEYGNLQLIKENGEKLEFAHKEIEYII